MKPAMQYRKIEVRLRGAEKFLELTAILPRGQGLRIFVMGPHTDPLRGLLRTVRAQASPWSTHVTCRPSRPARGRAGSVIRGYPVVASQFWIGQTGKPALSPHVTPSEAA